MKKELSIIIVTFDSSVVIKQCLERLNFDKYQVFVVDNASSDNTVEIVEKNFPQVNLIKLDKNIGYGRGNNAALRIVDSKFALVLNPDCFIAEEEIEKVLNLIKDKEDIAMAAPLLFKKYPESQQDLDLALEIARSNLVAEDNDLLFVSYLIGAAVFLRMSVFRKIGFYDENIFLYYEDDEICYRAIKNGYKCAIDKNAEAFHLGHASSKKTFRNIYRRNLHLFLSKLYWKEKRKGKLAAIKSAIRLTIFCLIKTLFYSILFNKEKIAENAGLTYGSTAYIIGLKPFRKNGYPRG